MQLRGSNAWLSKGCAVLLLCGCNSLWSAEPTHDKIPMADLQRFTKVIEYIKEYYVKPVGDEVLFENAIRGMLEGLDPHSNYFDAEEFASLKENTSGQFGGLGIEVLPGDGYIRVISPIDGSPAERAGIQAGDLIIRLNDTLIRGLTPQAAIELLRGEKGSKIKLTIIRQSENKPLTIEVVRDTITAQSVRARMLDADHAYVRIGQFQNNSNDELVQILRTLKKNNRDVLKGIILDLRNNPGGVFESGVEIANTFLDRDQLKQYEGLIVYAKGRLPQTQIREKAHGHDLLNGAPIVVLINSGSASCSEIVAGALQDYHRALIVGTQSYGKGSMQTVFSLKDNRGLKLTTQLYYTPSGRSIQATGIKPDVVVHNRQIPEPEQPLEDPNLLLIREADLQGHLENSAKKDAAAKDGATKNPATADNSAKSMAANQEKTDNLLYTDYQLYEGYNMLRALTLSRAQ